MSAPKVDVLAKLRSRFAECENGDYGKGVFMHPADARQIHYAVVELIEALRKEDEWRRREAEGAIDPEWDYESMVGQYRRAALDRIGGAA